MSDIKTCKNCGRDYKKIDSSIYQLCDKCKTELAATMPGNKLPTEQELTDALITSNLFK